ncbi:MAG: D-glycero-beta-D-manno-heptose 1,7-bisphosphate 7-phosphatase [Endomicrobiia bacterium]|nr:MAG: D-glycero-beta-D-manno-heptose 1,7-bisphosphate 7-phosphatase [Endomicrobiia bacterium]
MGTENIKAPAVFLDRDGTIIFDRNYLNSHKKVKLYSFSAQSINRLRTVGFKIIIATNQSGISRGMFTEGDLMKVNKKLLSLLKTEGAKVDFIYYCPHSDFDNCCCRKPKPGMALRVAKDFDIDLKKSYAVGDSVRDYLFGFNMGGKGILVLTGHGRKQQATITDKEIKPLAVCKTLKQATDFIIKDVAKTTVFTSVFK